MTKRALFFVLPVFLAFASFSCCDGGSGTSSVTARVVNTTDLPVTDIRLWFVESETITKHPDALPDVELTWAEREILEPGEEWIWSHEWDRQEPDGEGHITYTFNGDELGIPEDPEDSGLEPAPHRGELWDPEYHVPSVDAWKPYNNWPMVCQEGHSDVTITISKAGYTLKGDVFIAENGKGTRVYPDDPAYLDK